jgi:hypothetical protein
MKTRFILSLFLIAALSVAVDFAIGIPAVGTASVLFAIGFLKGIFAPGDAPKNMAYDFVISDTTYAGEAASSFIVKAITGNETVQGGHMYVKDGIKKKFTIPRFDADYEDLIQDRQPTPTKKGDFTVDGKVLEPQDYMIYTEFNPRDYEAHWYAQQLNPTLIDRSLPVSVESTMIQEVMKRHDRYMNKAIWNSSTALAAPSIYRYYNGLIAKAKAANSGADATNFVLSPTTLAANNIVAELDKGWALVPSALKYDPNMKVFVSYKTYDLYMQAQKNQTNKGVDFTQQGVARYNGLQVVRVADMPDDTYLMAKGTAGLDSNLWLGLNSSEDENKVELAKLQANSELYFIKILMKVDVQIGFNSETVYYGQ